MWLLFPRLEKLQVFYFCFCSISLGSPLESLINSLVSIFILLYHIFLFLLPIRSYKYSKNIWIYYYQYHLILLLFLISFLFFFKYSFLIFFHPITFLTCLESSSFHPAFFFHKGHIFLFEIMILNCFLKFSFWFCSKKIFRSLLWIFGTLFFLLFYA